MKILGIESSCDETAAAVVEIDDELQCTLLSNVVASSMDLHVQYGGVVPEIAARSHIESIIPVIDEAVAAVGWDAIDAIAVTYGAGLGGSLLVGVMTARTLAIAKGKPLYGVNHVEGHVYANFITSTTLDGYSLPASAPAFPCLALIVSGGHSQLALFRDHFDYTLLGQTQDDAVGEAFDKVAKMIGLPYPGGPSVGKLAAEGNPEAFTLPKAQMKTVSPAVEKLRLEMRTAKSVGTDGVQGAGEELEGAVHSGTATEHRSPATQQSAVSNTFGYDFSFSGPKTAVLRAAQAMVGQDFTFPSTKLPEALSEAHKADIAAVFQRIAIETVVDKTIMAFEEFSPASVVIAGGVAASPELRRQLSERLPLPVQYQDPKLCTDNGAMVATLGAFKAKLSQQAADPYTLAIEPNLSM